MPSKKRSAGVLLFRWNGAHLEVLLAHPGGPFWKNRDDGVWSIPKGEYGDDEDPLAAAKRELKEETGLTPSGNYIPLGEVRQRGGKVVTAWAIEANLDPAYDVKRMRGNAFSMPWPSGSTKLREFPEIDRTEWFPLELARRKILMGQAELIERLFAHLHRR